MLCFPLSIRRVYPCVWKTGKGTSRLGPTRSNQSTRIGGVSRRHGVSNEDRPARTPEGVRVYVYELAQLPFWPLLRSSATLVGYCRVDRDVLSARSRSRAIDRCSRSDGRESIRRSINRPNALLEPRRAAVGKSTTAASTAGRPSSSPSPPSEKSDARRRAAAIGRLPGHWPLPHATHGSTTTRTSARMDSD